jgi:hypothetical protein
MLLYFAMRCCSTRAWSGRAEFEREVELLVLRHQLKVISRNIRRAAAPQKGPHAARRGESDLAKAR